MSRAHSSTTIRLVASLSAFLLTSSFVSAAPANTRSTAVPYSALPSEPRVQSAALDDGLSVTLETGAGARLIVRRNRHRVSRIDLRVLRPWKLRTVDVDGDGRRDIVLGVYKSTRFWPYPHPCLFVYRWDERLVPVWRGANLSKPFVDFEFADGHLFSIEVEADGSRCLNSYHWNGFGFTGEWQRGHWKRAAFASTSADRITVSAGGALYSFRTR